jgi:hypothetical protein
LEDPFITSTFAGLAQGKEIITKEALGDLGDEAPLTIRSKINDLIVMNASRDFARQQRLAPLGFRAVFVGTFRQHIVAQTTVSGRLHIRTLGVIFTHLWVYPNEPLRHPYLFQWIAPFDGTKV